jgi:gas vesicle protein
LSGHYSAAVTAAEHVAGMVGGIAQATGRIVESLQFHDITRQQIEHVVEVINTLAEHIDSPGCAPREGAMVLRKVCALQASQLGQTRNEIMDALEQVKDSLIRIGQGVGEIMNATSATVLGTDGAFMDRVLQGIEAVMQGLEATSSEESVLMETVRATSAQVSLMSDFVREIEELGVHLQLIALNARIKAAHLGMQGAALDTISGSIYGLSREARQDTVALSEVLCEVARISQGAWSDLGQAEDHQQGAVTTLMATMEDLKAGLTQVNGEVQALVAELCRQGQALQDDIQACVAGITVHDDMRTVLENALSVLEGIHAETMDMADGEEVLSAMQFLAELEQRYTMQSERRIHQLHAVPECSDTGGDQALAGSDLGGNVELF